MNELLKTKNIDYEHLEVGRKAKGRKGRGKMNKTANDGWGRGVA